MNVITSLDRLSTSLESLFSVSSVSIHARNSNSRQLSFRRFDAH
jgi:hypothetical protein